MTTCISQIDIDLMVLLVQVPDTKLFNSLFVFNSNVYNINIFNEGYAWMSHQGLKIK